VQITVEKVKRQKGTLTNKEKPKMKSRTKMKKYDSVALLPWKKKISALACFYFYFIFPSRLVQSFLL